MARDETRAAGHAMYTYPSYFAQAVPQQQQPRLPISTHKGAESGHVNLATGSGHTVTQATSAVGISVNFPCSQDVSMIFRAWKIDQGFFVDAIGMLACSLQVHVRTCMIYM